MSGDATTTGGSENQEQAPQGGEQQQQVALPTSQEDLDRIIGERLARERAKFKDYNDLKAKASKFDEFEAANQTELEKAIKRAEKAEQEANSFKAQQLRLSIASKHNLTGEAVDLLSGSTEEELEANAEKLAKLLQPGQIQGRTVPGMGSVPATSSTSGEDWLRAAARRR